MTSVQRALELTNFLNNPSDAAQIHLASEELQQIQLSQAGWQVADAMLGENDPNVKFYGALTFQIKLNKEGASIDENLYTALLGRIITWLNTLAGSGEKRLVLDKLSSTLSTLFIQTPSTWHRAVYHLIYSLSANKFVPSHALEEFHNVSQLFLNLAPQKQIVVVRFCQSLAEDMCASLVQQNQKQVQKQESFKTNTVDVADIMAACFNHTESSHLSVAVEALNCFTAWINYGHSAFSGDPVCLEYLQLLTPLAARFLESDIDGLRDPAIDMFVHTLEYRLRFLRRSDLELISNLVREKLGPLCVKACVSGQQDPDIVTLSKLVAAYGKATVRDVFARRKDQSSEELIALFHGLLAGPGYPGDDDELILSASDFWIDYAEYTADAVVDSDPDNMSTSLPLASNDLIKAAQLYIPKLDPPTREVQQSWDEGTYSTWTFFRSNVSEFLEAVAAVPDTYLLQQLVNLAMHVLPNKQWLRLEAIIYCINAISDVINPADEEVATSTLLGSSLFNDISDPNNDVPVILKRAVLKTVDCYSAFIKANPNFIPPVLTFLFTVLESAPNSQEKTADQAAKSFEALCSSCRRALTPHIDELLSQCPRALSGPSSNSYQREKVLAALASIIQALPNEEAKYAPLLPLLEVIGQDLRLAEDLLQRGGPDNIEQGDSVASAALQCLASIAKGIQAPDDAYIDLDSDDESVTKPSTSAASHTFWATGPGQELQQSISACFQIVDFIPPPHGGDAIDAICSVLRAGLAETQPGPFVFQPTVTVHFIDGKCRLDTPRIETILSTACTFISACSRGSNPHLMEEVLLVKRAVVRVTSDLGTPGNDPQLAQICVDFLHRLLGCYLDSFLYDSDESILKVLMFIIECLTGTAPNLKRGACNFFETFVGLARPNNPAPLPPTRVPVSEVMNHIAPVLANALVYQISGIAQRSELDGLCKPVRAFIFGISNAKRYLEEALANNTTEPVGTVEDKDKRVFLAKIMNLRGGKQTNVVVKEYWTRCKGTVSKFE